MMRYLLLGLSFGVCILFLSSCGSRSEGVALLKAEDVKEYDSRLFSDMLQTVEYIPLESDTACLLGQIEVIKKRSGRFYIHANKNKLYVFDDKGHFLFPVGMQGGGAG